MSKRDVQGIPVINNQQPGYRDDMLTVTAGSKEELRRVLMDEHGIDIEDVQVRVFKKNLWGRNERCPCGSGKKFKKCCAGTLGDTFITQIDLDKRKQPGAAKMEKITKEILDNTVLEQ